MALPTGFREDPDTFALRCPHRDLSTCKHCVAQYEQIVEGIGVEYWCDDPDERHEVAVLTERFFRENPEQVRC